MENEKKHQAKLERGLKLLEDLEKMGVVDYGGGKKASSDRKSKIKKAAKSKTRKIKAGGGRTGRMLEKIDY
jgi:hypothetical protein